MASSAVLIVQEEQFEDEDFALSEESQEFLEKGYEKLPQCKNRRNYACPECDYFTQNPRSYLHHLKDVHKHKIRIYECPNCLYASKHSQKLQRHVQMVHGMGKSKKWKPQQKFDEVENSKFEEIHDELTEDKMFKCPMCPFTSRSQTLVVRHEKVVHLKKKFFRCSKCNYVTHMKARFTKHVKYHSMPMIKCEQCDFKSPYKWNLDRHMKNHAGGGAFKCSLCNFTADIKQSLTVHEMNHHVPPVGHTAPSKRKNRVGASDSNPTEPSPVHDDELLQLERDADMHQSQMHAFNELSMLNEIEITKKPENPSSLRKPVMKKPKPMAQFSAKELTVKIGEKVVNPGDVIQHKNGTVYIKKLKCRVCNYRAAWESEMSRHEQRVHGLEEKKPIQKSPRPIPDLKPIPNLIPIQNKQPPQQTRPTPPPPPALPLPPPPALPLMHQSRPMMQKHMMPHLPFQQGMNRHPFLHHHLQPHHPPPPYPQSHNLPPQYPHHLPSRFAQPKNIMPKMKGFQVNQLPKQKPPRPSPPPPPILKIPTPTKLRNSATSTPPPSNSSNSTPASTPDKTMTDKDLNDICAKSCPTSSLKDFASLMGGDEAFRPGSGNNALTKGACDVNRSDKIQDSIDNHNDDGPKSPEAKKKNSFFDELKEKFGAGESCNLICNLCGHESKCLSESLRHQKIHSFAGNNSGGGTVFSNADLSSTRCQYCRQRCKTSADLLTHLKSCAEANKGSTEPINIEDEDEEEEEKGDVDEADGERMEFKDGETDEDYKSEEGLDDTEGQNPHPMENKVFVWTNMANGEEDGLDDEYECGSQSPSSDCVFGVETAPGIGAVTSTNKAASHGNQTGQMVQNKEVKPKPDNSVKKVYKCPHCSFWASTASRFHVHIVGHLNKKPFECSLCCYRSNWRWDITKHIRLKTMRDSTHQRAKVLMTDETGRRNYSKYNKYLTLMRVHEPAGESSGTGLRGKKVTQSFEPIETLPAPPKLTPAPQSSLQGENNGPASNGSSPTYRPAYSKPPPLQPSYDMKRKNAEDSEDEPPKKKGPLENKKTMWKCKKCLFRDSDRAVVLAHVKEHYRTQSLQAGNDSSDERHCRLKHNGDVKVILAPRHNSDEQEKTEDENEAESFLCETCPFVGTSQQSLDEHMEKHFERPDAPFKCYFCPFYVSDNNELMEHMSLHGEPESDDSSTTFREEDSSSVVYSPSKDNTDLFMNKRYRCSSCPYVTNSKTQFLYHKQFHRPRGAPFQCHLCSYNVPRRHFLQQHLRLHGINTPLPKIKNSGTFDPETPLNIKEIDTSNMPEIPLVWVSKLGSLTKMFKCRYCPHVNIRKSNIQEHEKMHGIRVKPNSEGSSPIPQQQHHCPECNYICNNAGVLSSHVKVHQGLFGQVCGLVDLSRSDEEQIRDLNTLLGREEEGPPEISPDEINKDFKENSSTVQSTPEKDSDSNVDNRVLHFCSICPARFLYTKELEIHMRFHSLQLQFQCDSCSYTARQQPHLLAHYKVHTDEYQDRTTALCEVYQISEENPKPKIAVIVDGSEEVGPAWVVVERQKLPAKDPQNEYDLDEAPSEVSQHGNRIVIKQFACDKCPATFFKAVALQYHSALHGGPGPHKCRVCDYAVKTYGNLIKHESVHEDLQPRAKLKNKSKKAQENIPTSGTELFKQKTEANQKVAAAPPPPPAPLHIDPEFGILMHGSPEFIYPTYLKNGRLKEKRYKCHKCPSAFEKREQYKVHLSLHGSKQRYSCERCDYSVKYYANYIQHLRKHQSNDVCKAERKTSGDRSTEESVNEDGSESTTETPIPDEILPQPPMSSRSGKKMQLSMADQQATMLMQQRVISNSMSAPEIINRCPQCPYSNQRKDGVGSHVKCHSNVKGGAFACKYCDYTVPQQHFLREHNKLHFSPLKSHRPEAYMKLDRLELWSEPVLNNDEDKTSEDKPKKVLIFKDRGVNFKEDRFLPVYSEENSEQPEDEKERIYINMKTGEVDNSNSENSDSSEKEDVREGVELNTADENNLTVNSVIPAECGDIPANRESNIINSEKPDIDCQMPSEETKSLDKDKDDEVLASPMPMEVDEEKCHDIPNSPVSSGNVVQEETADSRSSNIADNFVNSETDACILAEVKTINQGNDLSNETKNVTESALELENFEAADHDSRGSKVDEKSKEVQTANQPSDGESGDKTEVKASTEGTSDSDSEDSSSDSSSSDDSQDSSSSSVTSSQPQQ